MNPYLTMAVDFVRSSNGRTTLSSLVEHIMSSQLGSSLVGKNVSTRKENLMTQLREGNSLVFRRGRNGGVFLLETAPKSKTGTDS
jgi:hypothetical protein